MTWPAGALPRSSILNASLSFHNVWPTPADRLARRALDRVRVVLLAARRRPRLVAPLSRGALRGLPRSGWCSSSATTPTSRRRRSTAATSTCTGTCAYMPDVAAMVARAAPLWLIVVALGSRRLSSSCSTSCSGGPSAASARHWPMRARAADRAWRRAMIVALFAGAAAAGTLFDRLPFEPRSRSPTPVAQTYARQARLVARRARRARQSLPPSPSMDADLARVRGADVFLFFIESYGAIALRAAGYRAATSPPSRAGARGRDPRHAAATSCRRSSSRRPSAARRGSRT